MSEGRQGLTVVANCEGLIVFIGILFEVLVPICMDRIKTEHLMIVQSRSGLGPKPQKNVDE